MNDFLEGEITIYFKNQLLVRKFSSRRGCSISVGEGYLDVIESYGYVINLIDEQLREKE
jgi:hypothetical protein